MKLVLTLTVRDEADLVGDRLRYDFESGVDFVLATDHGSVDGTTDVLREYERQGLLRLLREEGDAFRQSEWVTRMARLAATDHAADWVVNSDADEFWWPRQGSLKETLASVPRRFGVVRGIWRNFVLRPDSESPFYERMTLRQKPVADPASPYHAQVKVAHRADPHVVVPRGNHDALGARLLLLREWFPFEILHFPLRRREQVLRKYAGAEAYRAGSDPRLPRHTAALASQLRADADATYRALVVAEPDPTLTRDVRLRSRLRGEPQSASPRSLADEVALAEEIDLLLATDAAQRLRGRVEAFEARLARIESRRAGAARLPLQR